VFFRDSLPYIPGSYYRTTTFHILSGDLHILKNKSQTLTISFVFYEAWLCYLTIVIRYLRGLTLLSEHLAQSTAEIVVPYSIIDDKPHCTTMYMYPIEGFIPFHQAGRFISETIYYFKNIKSQTLTISFVFYEAWLCYLTIVIRYFRGLTLFSLMNVVVL
jgi:hypothetical protein